MRFLTLSFMLFSFQIQAATNLVTDQELGCLKSAFLYSIEHRTPWITFTNAITVEFADDLRNSECRVGIPLPNDEYCAHHKYYYIVDKYSGAVKEHYHYQVCEQG